MAILDDRTLDFVSTSLPQTERLGIRLGELLEPRDVVCLSGELGAGKTALARGVGRGWGSPVRVTSPTFVLVNEYPRPSDGCILYHIDGYRLERTADIVTVGLEDILDGDAPVLIEWPEHIVDLLPPDRLWITLTYDSPTRRRMRLSAMGPRSTTLLTDFRKNAFGV
ncbi:MAG: tRNA (adenosine(37)-N6)-threonylcarbamoyltransferase complex ATPase subunit type 1 TsaE [Anaerolineae bacterium]|uniref:tRNA (adenosine(37)-N6)-threonylcarbamoyltransferase complex ATPase subunit type 1 TsaE n=1 Tax=Promineifilum sp. TaxID=2664178 RepID=UPI001D45C28D|nr:tRNA (adenosine(37)-N6)-threonylcarbamoyltransferase complex ATPase subunit type 1 TsaE [Anaerolineales bacterium]MCB8935370.1 tRNA (adenosine(37)-N6)-threonylcarbamoyltransferase complex ATPase subunit type 1 TsaE [Promineifilum sp.]MCO5181984.1 tRNA (adenosine(37)-N6)-threonylcarbamoyltransferase complex ATPase subunit type 1 TsaE [Promineifilum sp.]MCW5846523.1 tRNA (adenosine(37)-N6)-threonylcarbamoyltransferase complex ATPase subunit type 1 TsaE [Anaerolineae bacterium]